MKISRTLLLLATGTLAVLALAAAFLFTGSPEPELTNDSVRVGVVDSEQSGKADPDRAGTRGEMSPRLAPGQNPARAPQGPALPAAPGTNCEWDDDDGWEDCDEWDDDWDDDDWDDDWDD